MGTGKTVAFFAARHSAAAEKGRHVDTFVFEKSSIVRRNACWALVILFGSAALRSPLRCRIIAAQVVADRADRRKVPALIAARGATFVSDEPVAAPRKMIRLG